MIDQGRDRALDLLITTPGHVILVSIQRSERLGDSILNIVADYREPIQRIREIPGGGPVCRELWLYSRYETLRFFRIENSALIELGADGMLLPADMGNGENRISGQD
jgi:hypothetical protein